MTNKADVLDAIVVGAGWAGLGISQSLTQAGLHHRVLERGRIGETWRTQRWRNYSDSALNSRSARRIS